MANTQADGEEREFDHAIETAVVTGATGSVGSWVTDRLADDGVEVVGIDLERPAGARSNAHFRSVDLTEQGPTWETIHEVDPDAVVHCAAISGPLDDPGTRVYENNVMSTYNTLVAAGRADAEVVWTSSQAVYGPLFAAEPWVPDDLPTDEETELRAEDPYGTSNAAGEEIAAMVARRYDVPVTTLRPTSIYTPGDYRARPQREGFDLSSAELSGNFWSYVDVRDVARMVEAALAADLDGHEVFCCTADGNYLGHPTAELIEAAGHNLPADHGLSGDESAFSNRKAEELLGWEPTVSWRGVDEDAPSHPEWL